MSSPVKSTKSPKKNMPPVIGYIHDLSRIRQGPKCKWFDMKLQTASGRVRAVCFSKDKYNIFAEKEKTITPAKISRSRFSKYYECRSYVSRAAQHHREPSRIPVKKLVRVLNKQRKFRKVIRRYVIINIPSTSKIHGFTHAFSSLRRRPLNFSNERQKLIKRNKSFTQHESQIIKKDNFSYKIPIKNENVFCVAGTKDITTRFESLFWNTSQTLIVLARSLYLLGRIIYVPLLLRMANDVEENPGPTLYDIVDPSKTICADFSQSNARKFGPNAGKQCVAMSLTAIVQTKVKDITTWDSSFINKILSIGNNLYT